MFLIAKASDFQRMGGAVMYFTDMKIVIFWKMMQVGRKCRAKGFCT